MLDLLPAHIRAALAGRVDTMEELIIDAGRHVVCRETAADGTRMAGREVTDAQGRPLRATFNDVTHVCHSLIFDRTNRSTIPGTLHRVSRLPLTAAGRVPGLTIRVGRHNRGCVDALLDVLLDTSKSILLLGRPGIGKTTLLREVASVLASRSSVVVVDKSCEIGGGDVVPHSAIGHARRMVVTAPRTQDEIMLQAVINHGPEVIVVDEIGTLAEAHAAASIAQRGVRLVATAHGNDLASVVQNPKLKVVLGGTHSVIQGDVRAVEAAAGTRRRVRGRDGRAAAAAAAAAPPPRKTCTERQNKPVFDVVVELLSRNHFRVHHNSTKSVDMLLTDGCYMAEERQLQPASRVVTYRTVRVTPDVDGKGRGGGGRGLSCVWLIVQRVVAW